MSEEAFHDLLTGINDRLDRIADALELIVLNMEKPIRTRQDYLDEMETLG